MCLFSKVAERERSWLVTGYFLTLSGGEKIGPWTRNGETQQQQKQKELPLSHRGELAGDFENATHQSNPGKNRRVYGVPVM